MLLQLHEKHFSNKEISWSRLFAYPREQRIITSNRAHLVKESLGGITGGQQLGHRRPRTLAEQRHRVRVAAERGHVVVHPAERRRHVLEAVVAGRERASGAEETCARGAEPDLIKWPRTIFFAALRDFFFMKRDRALIGAAFNLIRQRSCSAREGGCVGKWVKVRSSCEYEVTPWRKLFGSSVDCILSYFEQGILWEILRKPWKP